MARTPFGSALQDMPSNMCLAFVHYYYDYSSDCWELYIIVDGKPGEISLELS